MVASACDTVSNYETLSFFFDGVPKQDSTIIKLDSIKFNQNAQKALIASQLVSHSHKPFSNRECAKCHQSSFSNKLNKEINDLCFDCHTELVKDSLFVHGPVASGYCFKCHEPHSSTNKRLLLKVDQNLCYECHLKTEISINVAHKEIQDTVCWVCHNPHSYSKQYFLKN